MAKDFIDISDLERKVDNEDARSEIESDEVSPDEYLSADEFVNKIVKPIRELQDEAKQAVIVKLPMTSVTQKITVTIPASFAYVKNQVEERCFDFLNQAEISFVLKDRIYSLLRKGNDAAILVAELSAMELDPDLYGALVEIITA